MLELTMRTTLGCFLMRPTPTMTSRLLCVLGRSLQQFPVLLHGFVFLSNHAHLLFTAASRLIASGFQGHLKQNTARAIQALTGWEERVWGPGTTLIPVLDDPASIRRLGYVLSNSVKEGLVDHPLAWPGASSARALVGDGTVVVPTFRPVPRNQTAERRHPLDGCEEHVIKLAPLPCWEHHSDGRRAELVGELLDRVTGQAIIDRRGAPALGIERVLAQDPFEPRKLERRPPPIAHYTDPAAFEAYCRERDAHTDAFYVAAAAHRRIGPHVIFPEGSFTPTAGFVED